LARRPVPAGGVDRDGVGRRARREAEEAKLQEDAREQRRLFEARKEELVSKYPRQTIAMCAGEVFVGNTLHEAAVKAREAHPDRASFFHTYGVGCPAIWK